MKQNQEPQASNNEKTIGGGSILADKVFEPLQAMLDAYEARIKPNQTQEERIRAYPKPKLEIKRLEIYRKMIEEAQAQLNKEMNEQRHRENMKVQNQASKPTEEIE